MTTERDSRCRELDYHRHVEYFGVRFCDVDEKVDVAQTHYEMKRLRAVFCHAWMDQNVDIMDTATQQWGYCLLRLKLLRYEDSPSLADTTFDMVILGGQDG